MLESKRRTLNLDNDVDAICCQIEKIKAGVRAKLAILVRTGTLTNY